MDIRKLTDDVSVSPQIAAADVPAIVAAGFRSVVCNRPDGEASNQPCCEEISTAVIAAGLVWRAQPVISGGVTADDVRRFADLVAELPKPILAYCRTGTRCAMLWCLSEAGQRPVPEIVALAGSAGYDMSAVMQRAG